MKSRNREITLKHRIKKTSIYELELQIKITL